MQVRLKRDYKTKQIQFPDKDASTHFRRGFVVEITDEEYKHLLEHEPRFVAGLEVLAAPKVSERSLRLFERAAKAKEAAAEATSLEESESELELDEDDDGIDWEDLRDALDTESHKDLGTALKDLGKDVPSSKDDRMELARDLLG